MWNCYVLFLETLKQHIIISFKHFKHLPPSQYCIWIQFLNGFCHRDIPQNISLKLNGTLKAYIKDTTNGVCPQEPDEISLNYTDRNLICFCQSVHDASCKVSFLYFYPSRARPTSYVLPWWDLRAITASPKAYRKWKIKLLCLSLTVVAVVGGLGL